MRGPRRPVLAEFSVAEQERRQWSSLEHAGVDARRPIDVERTTRRVRSYEDRYLLQRQPETIPYRRAKRDLVEKTTPNAVL